MTAVLSIAHRGDSSLALENSLEAFTRALAYPVDLIELDVRKTSDDVLYVLHDKTTGRTADQDLEIENSLSSEIAGLRLRNGEPVPTLEDALGLVGGRAGLNLEIKSEGAGRLTAEFLSRSGYKGYVLLSSFIEEEVLAAHEKLPDLPLSLIFDLFRPKDIPAYAIRGYRIISLRKSAVTKALVEACRAHHVRVYVWTVDDEGEMQKLIDLGVDGIYTNRPAVLVDLLRRARS